MEILNTLKRFKDAKLQIVKTYFELIKEVE